MNIICCLAMFCMLFAASCNKSSTDAGENTDPNLYSNSIDGCQSTPLMRKEADNSILKYEFFNDSLVIKVFVEANCCPDSNRFKTSITKENNTLYLKVKDIEEGLCNCICHYEIQTVNKGAGLDSIHFTCDYYDSLIVSELICRNCK